MPKGTSRKPVDKGKTPEDFKEIEEHSTETEHLEMVSSEPVRSRKSAQSTNLLSTTFTTDADSRWAESSFQDTSAHKVRNNDVDMTQRNQGEFIKKRPYKTKMSKMANMPEREEESVSQTSYAHAPTYDNYSYETRTKENGHTSKVKLNFIQDQGSTPNLRHHAFRQDRERFSVDYYESGSDSEGEEDEEEVLNSYLIAQRQDLSKIEALMAKRHLKIPFPKLEDTKINTYRKWLKKFNNTMYMKRYEALLDLPNLKMASKLQKKNPSFDFNAWKSLSRDLYSIVWACMPDSLQDMLETYSRNDGKKALEVIEEEICTKSRYRRTHLIRKLANAKMLQEQPPSAFISYVEKIVEELRAMGRSYNVLDEVVSKLPEKYDHTLSFFEFLPQHKQNILRLKEMLDAEHNKERYRKISRRNYNKEETRTKKRFERTEGEPPSPQDLQNEKINSVEDQDWRRNVRCYNCGEKGHIGRECKKPDKRKTTRHNNNSDYEKENEENKKEKKILRFSIKAVKEVEGDEKTRKKGREITKSGITGNGYPKTRYEFPAKNVVPTVIIPSIGRKLTHCENFSSRIPFGHESVRDNLIPFGHNSVRDCSNDDCSSDVQTPISLDCNGVRNSSFYEKKAQEEAFNMRDSCEHRNTMDAVPFCHKCVRENPDTSKIDQLQTVITPNYKEVRNSSFHKSKEEMISYNMFENDFLDRARKSVLSGHGCVKDNSSKARKDHNQSVTTLKHEKVEYPKTAHTKAKDQENMILMTQYQETTPTNREWEDWSLDKKVYGELCKVFKIAPTRDAFATELSSKCEQFYSKEHDSFAQDWSKDDTLYLNPPFRLYGTAISKFKEEGERALVIFPHWPTTYWFKKLLSMIVSDIILLPKLEEGLFSNTTIDVKTDKLPNWRALAAVISTRNQNTIKVQEKSKLTRIKETMGLDGFKTYELSFNQTVNKAEWLMDSGCNTYATGNIHLLHDIKTLNENEKQVQVASGETLQVKGIGKMTAITEEGVELTLESVMYIPEINCNVLSINKLEENEGVEIRLKKGYMKIGGEKLKLHKQANLSYLTLTTRPLKTLLLTCNSAEENHQKFGHPGNNKTQLIKQYYNIDITHKPECEECLLAKQPRSPYTSSRNERKALKPLQRVCSDLTEITTPSVDGHAYIAGFEDQASKYLYIQPIKKKSETIDTFKRFIQEHGKPKILRSDNEENTVPYRSTTFASTRRLNKNFHAHTPASKKAKSNEHGEL